jgi:hypothetical protein
MAAPPTSVPPPLLNLTIEFGGGMELLFSDQHIHTISLPSHYSPSTFSLSPPPNHAPNEGQGKNSDVRFLIWWLRTYLLADKARYDLFSQGENMYVLSLPSALSCSMLMRWRKSTGDIDIDQFYGLGIGRRTRVSVERRG